jgi:hypothetical protein
MSRVTIYQDQRLTLVGGQDHMLGDFLQLFDKDMENETPEGEGLVFDWSRFFGTEINLTGISINTGKKPIEIINEYINENKCP